MANLYRTIVHIDLKDPPKPHTYNIVLRKWLVNFIPLGDSFVAAIAYGFIHKISLVHTLTIANAVGAATAMGCGAGRNVATRKLVTDLLEVSNLTADKFWEELLKGHSDGEEITVLTVKVVPNEYSNQFQRALLQNVVCELLPKLEFAERKQVAT